MKRVTGLALLVLLSTNASAQSRLETFFDGALAAQVGRRDVAGAVVAVVDDRGILFSRGFGTANPETAAAIDGESTLFRIGSITKVFTWLAVLALVEDGELELDTDVSSYLDFEIPDTFAEPVTLRDLMTHEAGFEDREFGFLVREDEEPPSLQSWLVHHMPARVYPPGAVPAYSNYGAALAAHIVERAHGRAWWEIVNDDLLKPLGMDDTSIEQPPPAPLAERTARGATTDGPRLVSRATLRLAAPPIGATWSTATDMAKLIRAMVRQDRAVLSQEAWSYLLSTETRDHAALNGRTLGLYEMSRLGVRIVGHEGDLEGFHSLLALFPDHDLGLFVAYNGPDGARHRRQLLDAFVQWRFATAHRSNGDSGEPGTTMFAADEGVPTTEGEEPDLARFAGWYQPTRRNHTTVEKASVLFGQASRIETDGDAVVFHHHHHGGRFVRIEANVFRDPLADNAIVIRDDPATGATTLFMKQLPTRAFEKMQWYESPPLHYGLYGSAVFLAATMIFGAATGRFMDHRFGVSHRRTRAERVARTLAVIQSVLVLVGLPFVAVVFAGTNALAQGQTRILSGALAIPNLVIALTVPGLAYAPISIRRHYWRVSGRIHYAVYVAVMTAFSFTLAYWNLVGFQL